MLTAEKGIFHEQFAHNRKRLEIKSGMLGTSTQCKWHD